MSESLRLLGYWTVYLGWWHPGGVARLRLPLQRAGHRGDLRRTRARRRWAAPDRRWPYAPFFALLTVGALLAMSAGFPAGTPLRDALTSAYYALEPLRFLRTSYKAAPARGDRPRCLERAGPRRRWRCRARAPGWAAAGRVTCAGPGRLAAVAAPCCSRCRCSRGGPSTSPGLRADPGGVASGDRRRAARHARRPTHHARSPAPCSASTGGATRSARSAPALSEAAADRARARAVRGPARGGLQATVDDLIQQGRLVPGQFAPLLQLMAVGEVVVDADGLPLQSGSLDPAGVGEPSQPAGLRAAAGAVRRRSRVSGRRGAARRRAAARARTLPRPRTGSRNRARQPGGRRRPCSTATPRAWPSWPRSGALPDRRLFYAGDLDRVAGLRSRRAAARAWCSRTRTGAGCWSADLLRANQGPTSRRRSDPARVAEPRTFRLARRAQPRPSPSTPACSRRAARRPRVPAAARALGRSPRSMAGLRRAGWAGR